MNKRHNITAILIATILMNFGCKEHQHTNHVALFHCRYLVVDKQSRKPIDFEITYSETVDPSLDGEGLTKIIKHSDGSQSLIHVGPPIDSFANKRGLTVNISADGYATKALRIQPNTSESTFSKEEVVTEALEAIQDSEQNK